jgi:predicted transcriptional regulator
MAATKKREAPQRTTMFLDPTLHKRLKHLAVDRGVPVTAIVNEALEAYVSRAERKEGRKRS